MPQVLKMTNGAGLRKGTRHLFARGFRTKGYVPLTTYLRTYKLGDLVNLKVNAAIYKVNVLIASETGWGRRGLATPTGITVRGPGRCPLTRYRDRSGVDMLASEATQQYTCKLLP